MHRTSTFLVLAFATFTAGAAEPNDQDALADAKEAAVISANSVSTPLGRLLLIDSRDQLCAVQFETAVVRGRERRESAATPPTTTPPAVPETLRVDYQWWVVRGLPDGKLESLRGGQRTLTTRTAVPGRAVRTFGTPFVECGTVKVAWTFPNQLSFSTQQPGGAKEDPELKLAPSAAEHPAEVNLKQITWYSLDPERKPRRLPIAELPK